MLNKLAALSDSLDNRGLFKLANRVDYAIKVFSEALQGTISADDLAKLMPGLGRALKNAVTFDLMLERDPDGRGNFVKAIPKIHDKWTDGFNLGDASKIPGISNYFTAEPIGETIEELEKGKWFEEGADLPFADPEDVVYSPEYLQKLREENLERGRQTQRSKRRMRDWGDEAIREVERESFLPESERSEEAKYYDLPKVPPSGFRYDPEWKAEEDRKKQLERTRMLKMRESKLMLELVKMADKLDRDGEHDLATEIDQMITMAARPKAPLKGLDDDIKKSLIIFLHNADKNVGASCEGLEEFFRRLRYFDVADVIKETGLDKVKKEMEKVQNNVDGALKRFYEMTHGKKPSKKDLEEMFADTEEMAQEGALDFFEAQMAKDKQEEDEEESEEDESEEEDEEEKDEELEKEPEEDDMQDFLAFWDEGE